MTGSSVGSAVDGGRSPGGLTISAHRGQSRHQPHGPRLPFLTDAVEKRLAIIGVAIGGRFRPIPGRALPPDRRTPEPTCQASYSIDAHTPPVGGPRTRSPIVLG